MSAKICASVGCGSVVLQVAVRDEAACSGRVSTGANLRAALTRRRRSMAELASLPLIAEGWNMRELTYHLKV
jgi:hypothetical protein